MSGARRQGQRWWTISQRAGDVRTFWDAPLASADLAVLSGRDAGGPCVRELVKVKSRCVYVLS